MRSFLNHISEAPKEKKPYSACDILSQPDHTTFTKLYEKYRGNLSIDPEDYGNEVDKTGAEFLYNIREWFKQEGYDKSRFLPKLKKTIEECKTRGEWTYYTGKVYRGVFKKVEGSNLKLEPKIVKKSTGVSGSQEMVTGTMTYVSKYDMQSWSAHTDVAHNFAEKGVGTKSYKPGDKVLKLPMLMETTISKQDSFMNPSWTGANMFGGESEVVRLSNKPLEAKVYIDLYQVFKGVRQMYAAHHTDNALSKMTLEKAEKFIHKTLKDMGGEAFAKFLLKRTMTNILPPDLMKDYKGQ
jgi:hypothetical protein